MALPSTAVAERSHDRLDLRPGEFVQVRMPDEILATLDADGQLDGLPFMPEMLGYCGKRFHVFRRAEKTCVDGHHETFREFRDNDVVLLDELRCSGVDHNGCARACMLFWKEAWLHRVDDPLDEVSPPAVEAMERLRARLKTSVGDGKFFCQSSELLQATVPLSKVARAKKCLREVMVGNRGAAEMASVMTRVAWRKFRKRFVGKFPSGHVRRTPVEKLGLVPGDMVEIRNFDEILSTLDQKGRNRGLQCSFAMRQFCGKRYRVKQRLERMIIETNGHMREIENTVTLEGVNCQCYYAFGACPREEPLYWREIWLRRV